MIVTCQRVMLKICFYFEHCLGFFLDKTTSTRRNKNLVFGSGKRSEIFAKSFRPNGCRWQRIGHFWGRRSPVRTRCAVGRFAKREINMNEYDLHKVAQKKTICDVFCWLHFLWLRHVIPSPPLFFVCMSERNWWTEHVAIRSFKAACGWWILMKPT